MNVERIALIATPLVAMATLALGLQVGAPRSVHGAIIYGAPLAKGAKAYAWQLVSILDDRGVREAIPAKSLTVRARAGDQEATWRGSTNADGVAEIALEMPWLSHGQAAKMEVTEDGVREPLATGELAWDEGAWMEPAPSAYVRPSKRTGDVQLDVAIAGAALTPGFPTSIWVRAQYTRTLPGLRIEADPEPGLLVTPTSAMTCAGGWAEMKAEPQIHVIGLTLRATTGDGHTGEWAGAPPVAPGAAYVALPPSIDAGEARSFEVRAPGTRPIAYVEIDDEAGRAFGAALDLRGQGVPHATLDVPPLDAGLHWLVTSGEPRGAESLRGAAVARPFWVEPKAGPRKSDDACALGAFLATHPAGGFRKWVALDGFVGRKDRNAANHAIGLALALGSLAVAALLELLLIVRGAARTRADLARAASDLDDRAELTRRTSAGSVVVGILVALLGFGLLASMLLWRAG